MTTKRFRLCALASLLSLAVCVLGQTPTNVLASFSNTAGEHVYYIGTDGHIYQLYRNALTSSESLLDVTIMAGAPVSATGSALTSFSNTTGEHVYYVGTDQYVYQLYYNFANRTESVVDLTVMAGAPLAVPWTSLTSFSNVAGEHLYYMGWNDYVYQLYLNPLTMVEELLDLTAMTGAPLVAWGPATSFSNAAGEHVYYMGLNYHIYQLYWNPATETESVLDLTAMTGAPLVAWGPITEWGPVPMTSFSNAAGEHVYYLGFDRHIYQLYWNSLTKTESVLDLTVMTGAPLAVWGPLTSFSDTAGEHLYYVGWNSHICQLYWNSSTRTESVLDLTLMAGAPLPAWRTPLTSFSNVAGEHLYYIGTDQHVYQLYWDGRTERSIDETAAAGFAITTR